MLAKYGRLDWKIFVHLNIFCSKNCAQPRFQRNAPKGQKKCLNYLSIRKSFSRKVQKPPYVDKTSTLIDYILSLASCYNIVRIELSNHTSLTKTRPTLSTKIILLVEGRGCLGITPGRTDLGREVLQRVGKGFENSQICKTWVYIFRLIFLDLVVKWIVLEINWSAQKIWRCITNLFWLLNPFSAKIISPTTSFS